jgi:hypothetical protein
MPADIAKIILLDRLYKLRRNRRRLSASIITTFSINLPFYEDVVLRYLEAAGSRLNVLLVDEALGQGGLVGITSCCLCVRAEHSILRLLRCIQTKER